jgi:ABC-type branched-subunit amino acid transport system ATPase component
MLKIFKIIDPFFKIKIINFYALLSLVTIFEFLSVFVILPISQVFFKKKIEVSFFLRDYLNSTNYETLIGISVISLIVIYLIKNIFIIYFSWWKLNFIKKFEEKISYQLIKNYFNKDYNFFQKNSIGNFSNYLINEVQNLSSCLLAVLQLISELLIFIVIAGLLIYYQTQITIFLIILILAIAIITGLPLRKYVIRNGEKWVKSSNKLSNFVIQCYNSIIEIKVYSKFNFFSNIFNRYKSENLIFSVNNSIIAELPKPIFEFILILSFSALAYYMLSVENVQNLPEIMALFLAGAYRLIPAVSRFSVLYQTLNRNKYLIKTFLDQLSTTYVKEKIVTKNQKLIYNFNEKIELKNISFYFKKTEQKIINNISLLIKKDEKVAIVGKSGCGKTTLLNIILGFLKPNEGNFIIDNNEGFDLDQWLTCISYVPQNPVILNDTIKTNVTLEHDNINFYKLKFAIDNAGLANDIKKFPNQLETLLGSGGINLSTGQKQRISIARALYKNSQIIILDEPTSALDIVTEKIVLENLFSLKNKTIIMVTHKTNFQNKFDQVIRMDI